MATRSRYRSFTTKEKLRIIEKAENIGNRVAGRKYDLSESCIRDWRNKKTKRDLQRRIVGLIVGHFTARKRGIRNLKKGYAITWTIKDNMDAQLLVKCAKMKALAVSKN